MRPSRFRPVLAGMLVANSAPHLASAVANRQHMTPLAGKRSGPMANGVWGLANLVAAGLALRASRSPMTTRWRADLLAFETGFLAFAAWMAGSERLFSANSDRR
jgi:hypothetical protein